MRRLWVSAEVYPLAGVLLLTVPLPWLGAWFAAAAIHEAGHYLAVRLSGGQVYEFRITGAGAVLEAGGLTAWQSLLCILSGPAAGLLPLLVLHRFPRTAVCALVQTGCNLLPIMPLDGGRALQCLKKCRLKRGGEITSF